MFTTASFCWGDKAEFPIRRASQQRDMLPRGRGHPAWSGGRHSGSSSLPQVALGPLGQVSSWPSPRDVAFLSRAFALLSGMRGHPFFQILSLPCRRSRTNAPQHMSLLPPRQPLNCHLPGIHAPELKRLTECDRGLDSSLCVATNALGIGNTREKVENVSKGPQPSRPHARCLASVARGLPNIPAVG